MPSADKTLRLVTFARISWASLSAEMGLALMSHLALTRFVWAVCGPGCRAGKKASFLIFHSCSRSILINAFPGGLCPLVVPRQVAASPIKLEQAWRLSESKQCTESVLTDRLGEKKK